MLRKVLGVLLAVASIYLSGCASVPMASNDDDALRKQFSTPPENTSGLYIYRNSTLGGALKKTITVDGQVIGESAPKTYFYLDLKPGTHTLATESEFSDNMFTLDTEGGKNYFVRQYMKLGVFVGGANFETVTDEVGKKGVMECKLAKSFE